MQSARSVAPVMGLMNGSKATALYNPHVSITIEEVPVIGR